MKTIIGFIVGFAVGLIGWILFPPEPVVKFRTQVIGRIVQEEVLVQKECPPPPTQQCLSPAYVLGLLKDCRNGRLDQADTDITLRR